MNTIIHEESNQKIIYHGEVLKRISNDEWIFGFRNSGRNYIWNCHKDYWKLV